MPKKCVLLLVAAAALSLNVAARSPDEVRAQCRAEGRPCVGLVLSGGGARGFAHVGVLEVLESLGVRVDVVAGTSMGAMVGGAYAAGFSVDELRETVLEVDWSKMLAPRAERPILPWHEKLDDYSGLTSAGVEISEEGMQFPSAFVPSEELTLFLNRKTSGVDSTKDLSDLAVPFAAVATDLVTGDRVVLQKECTLGLAMRASMSIPGAFAPVPFGEALLCDGGLIDNLPVSLARQMGADVVIAVNVGTPLADRSELKSAFGVMGQMVNLLTEQNVKRSIASLTDADVLITPDLHEFSSADLNESRQIIDRGREAAQKAAEVLRRFARPKAEWAAWNRSREAGIRPAQLTDRHSIGEIRVAGRSAAAERLLTQSGLADNRTMERREIDDAMRKAWAGGEFETVNYRFEPGPRGMETLVIEPRGRKRGDSMVRIGGSVQSDFDNDSTFNLLFAHDWGNLNEWGGRWRNEVQFGATQLLRSELYQPLGVGSFWFVMPSAEITRLENDLYADGDAVATRQDTTIEGSVLLAREFSRLGYAGLEFGWTSVRTKDRVGRAQNDGDDGGSSPFAGVVMLIDTLDSVSFPTQGVRLAGSARRYREHMGDNDSAFIYEGEMLVPWSWGDWTATGRARIGRASSPGAFRLGGASTLPGAPYGRWSGSRLEYARLGLDHKVPLLSSLLHQPVWFGGGYAAGRAWSDDAPRSLDNASDKWHQSVFLQLGIDSLVGPIFFSFGRTMDEGSGVYFQWGYAE